MNIKRTAVAFMAMVGVVSCGVEAVKAYGRKKFREGKIDLAGELGVNYERYEKKHKK